MSDFSWFKKVFDLMDSLLSGYTHVKRVSGCKCGIDTTVDFDKSPQHQHEKLLKEYKNVIITSRFITRHYAWGEGKTNEHWSTSCFSPSQI